MKKVLLPLLASLTGLVLLSCPNPGIPSANNEVTIETPSPDVVVNIAAVSGVTPPVTGAMPVTTIPETAQYTGTVSWSPLVNGKFGTDTVISATITLIAKAGYTFIGVAANSFTVAGAIASNSINTGLITANFTAVANLAAVSDVTSKSQPGITLKAVQGGVFYNGTADMTVSSFRMSRHEITMEQFVAVTGLPNPSESFTDVVNGPVQEISWYHALVFCNKLSVADGLTPVYSIGGTTDTASWGAIPAEEENPAWNAAVADWTANGYRLPTETEWHFAARGGNDSDDCAYAGSNTIGDVAWYKGNACGTTHPVGGMAANELGLCDMTGNVWEWCWNWSGIYPATAQTDYRGAASGSGRVIRGGCWLNAENYCTVAYRAYSNSYTQGADIGFRIVRS